MSNLAKTLKDEIARIARKEAKQAVAPFRKPTTSARRTFADLKRRVVTLEKESRRLAALLAKVPQPEPVEVSAKAKGWISGKGVRSLRQKLGLSQEAFAKLVGVSSQGVYQWERKPGMLRLREATKAAVMAVRGLGAREAKARLAGMAAKKVAKKKRK
ncbi:MAG: helix-turn-helix domain-containing protein [Kiritimatiellia bacterium]